MGKTHAYYFSGTGNTLAVARDLANEIHGEAIPIASVDAEETLVSDGQALGIAFPVCYADAPSIIRRLARRVEEPDEAYL